MSGLMSVHITLTSQYVEPVKCHVYEDSSPILSFTNSPGESLDLMVDQDLLPNQQIGLAVQIAVAAQQFADALSEYHHGTRIRGDDQDRESE